MVLCAVHALWNTCLLNTYPVQLGLSTMRYLVSYVTVPPALLVRAVVFSQGSLEPDDFASTILGVPPEVMQMLRSTVYFNSHVQICEQGFLEPLECILRALLHQKG